jgi:hypothetical protein
VQRYRQPPDEDDGGLECYHIPDNDWLVLALQWGMVTDIPQASLVVNTIDGVGNCWVENHSV